MSILADTKLATLIEPRLLLRLGWLGERRELGPGEALLEAGAESDHLMAVIAGHALVEHAAEGRVAMAGAGEILGEVGWVLGGVRTRTVRAGPEGCTVWTLPRAHLQRPGGAERQLLLAHLLMALAPYLRIRHLMLSQPRAVDAAVLAQHCDQRHPAIVEVAARLAGVDDWDTATRVWRFVRALPYRFGFWRRRASETLALGYGMCTTKANLQVALLRAAGLEAQVAETRLDSAFVRPLLPPGYRSFVRRDIKHYFGVVRLDGRLEACDASFTQPALELLAGEVPEVRPLIAVEFGRDRPRIPFLDGEPGQPPPYRLLPDLAEVMAKEPFYDEDNAEAMNVLLDRHQGPVQQDPAWVAQVRGWLAIDPEQAFLRALSGLACDCARLRDTLTGAPA